jgi:ATP-binding cassette subfamily F protein 3
MSAFTLQENKMIQLQLANITLILGAKRIFENLNWEIQNGQKIGLVGANGAGKSSLFKMIEGEYSPELGGSITRARLITTGYLSQSPELDLTLTALEAALAGNPRVVEIHAELERVENSLGDPEIYGNERKLQLALEVQHKLVEEYHALGGDSYPARVRELLLGLGLAQSELTKPLSVLSGGQKKLVGLARLLLVRPDILLLDEPDNHLDLPGKMFLEKLIREYEGAVVLISHDRYLLDAAVTHIAELEDGKLTLFSGNYTEFVLDKEERLARQEELFQIQQRSLVRMEMALKRYKVWVQLNDKFASRMHAMEARMARVEKIDKPMLDRKRMEMRLSGWRGSNKVLELAGVSKSFGQKPVFSNLNETIWHGERVGLIGANGAGKSVLLRMVLEQEQPDTGEIKIGPSIKIGHYAQEHETLDFNQTVVDAVRYAGEMSETRATAFLLHKIFK